MIRKPKKLPMRLLVEIEKSEWRFAGDVGEKLLFWQQIYCIITTPG